MPTQPSPEREAVIAAIMRHGREESRLSVFFRALIARRMGIHVTDGECMDFLLEQGAATAGELAKLTGLTTGAITSVIRRLTRAGLATATPDPDDRRRVIVRPVLANVNEGIQLYESFGNALDKLYARYTRDELKFIAEYHRNMSDLLRQEIEILNNRSSSGIASSAP
jgi:MarR family transcriptional regulator, organic hydroperoxide resistance regulator